MAELILCQKEEITPVADAIRELCAIDEEMSLVSMRANITNAAAAMQDQNVLIGQITEALGAAPSALTPSIENNTKLLEDLLDTAENSAGLLPELTDEGSAGDLLKGKQLIDSEGQVVTGTIESKTATDVILNESTGVVSAPKGYYASNISYTIPNAETQVDIIQDNNHAYALITPTKKGYLKNSPVPAYIGEYKVDVNYTFNDITLTPHNIPQGYVATESSVQIAPAVVNEVDEQAELIAQILTAVNELPPQKAPDIILPEAPEPEPEPEPEPVGELTFEYSTGEVKLASEIKTFSSSAGSIARIKIGEEVVWEQGVTIVFPYGHLTNRFVDGNYTYGEIILTRAPLNGEKYVVYINGEPREATAILDTDITDGSSGPYWMQLEGNGIFLSGSYGIDSPACTYFLVSINGAYENPSIEVHLLP